MANTPPRDPILAKDESGKNIFGYNENGVAVCWSKTSDGTGRRCMSVARMQNGRCRTHGGATPLGAATGSFRTGLYSKIGGPGNKFAEAVDDPEYLRLKEELALNAFSSAHIIDKFENGFDAKTFEKIRVLVDEIEAIIFKDEMVQAIESFAVIDKKIGRLPSKIELLAKYVRHGTEKDKLFKELDSSMRTRARLVETELKKVHLDRNSMTTEEVFALFRSLVYVVTKIWGNDTLGISRFGKEIDSLTSQSARKIFEPKGIVEQETPVGRALQDFSEAVEEEKVLHTMANSPGQLPTHIYLDNVIDLAAQQYVEQVYNEDDRDEAFIPPKRMGFSFSVKEFMPTPKEEEED